MNKFAKFLIKARYFILIIFLILTILACILIPKVKTNYDLSKYLPSDEPSKISLDILKESYGDEGICQLLLKDTTEETATLIAGKVKALTHVKEVEFYPQSPSYYKDKNALIKIYFKTSDYDAFTSDTIDEIRKISGDEIAMSGSSVDIKALKETTKSSTFLITIFLIPLVLIVIFLCTRSYVEPIIFSIVLAVSIALNLGTNAFMGEISFITDSMVIALQLAISMDYAIFFLHKYEKQRRDGMTVDDSITSSFRLSFGSIMASATTTIAGFLAITFMRFTIGKDLGWVFAKGILISLLTVLLLTPALIKIFSKAIDKTAHKSFMPSLKGVGKTSMKYKRAIVTGVLLLLIPMIFFSNNNSFVYGNSVIGASEGSDTYNEKVEIEKYFGKQNYLVAMVPKTKDRVQELALLKKLQTTDKVTNVNSVVSVLLSPAFRIMPGMIPPEMLPPGFIIPPEGMVLTEAMIPFIPDALIPPMVTAPFDSKDGKYSRFIIDINTDIESKEAFKVVENVRNVLDETYKDKNYLTGESAVSSDMKKVIEKDFNIINLCAILAVAIIIMITFKSILLPILLTLTIEAGITIAMAIPAILGQTITFVGYFIINLVLLGSTIDYAILMCSKYKENLKTSDKKTAMLNGVDEAGKSILTSSFILAGAGFIICFASEVMAISQMGLLLGMGAFLSGLLSIVFLPNILTLYKPFKFKRKIKDKDALIPEVKK